MNYFYFLHKLMCEGVEMKNNKITWLIAAAAAVLLAGILIPRMIVSGNNHMGKTLDRIKGLAETDEWETACTLTQELENQWTRQKRLLALNFAEQDFSDFDDALCRVRSAVLVNDKSMTVSECTVAKELYNNLIRLIPEP
jgi:hypothetical protein